MVVEIALFVVGLLMLYFGAEGMVEGSSALALKWGVRPLVVGLTVVAFGTSAPELLVCLVAAFEENASDISVGNIVGSNVANILLILGCASLVKPIEVHAKAIRREFPIMLAAVLLFAVLLFVDEGNPELSRLDGLLLAVAMAGYLLYSFFLARSESPDEEVEDAGEELDLVDEIEDVEPDEADPKIEGLKVAGGMLGLALGAYLMVDSAKEIATQLGVPQLIIGISIVAFGTSLPELATSVVAAVRDESDISVGNVIGSNIFNVLLVLGTVSLITPLAVDSSVLDFDLWFLLGVSIGIWPVLRTGHKINRWEGAMMLVLYAGYISYLFMR